ncbi:PGPGW domain-containing protein [Janibacter massiliensis]|uniref:PGPGW domain-containing protein n=1 Tax=Janibacter massiliensis TaxID=2058291 RepID=UPI000D0ED9E1|nr:PGPGW domain-containing protein [Janibacter massiliensis]
MTSALERWRARREADPWTPDDEIRRGEGHWERLLRMQREAAGRAKEESDARFADDNITVDAHEDQIAWRRAIRRNPVANVVYRAVLGIVGLGLILVGIPMVPFVGPGWLVIFFGIAIWATEFEFAQRLLRVGKARVQAQERWVRTLPWSWRIIGAILTTIFAWGCVYASFMLTGIPGWVPDVIEHRLVQLPGLDPS